MAETIDLTDSEDYIEVDEDEVEIDFDMWTIMLSLLKGGY